MNPVQIPLTSPEDRGVQVGNEKCVHDVSLVYEPGDPKIVREPGDPEMVYESGDLEIVFEPLSVNRSTAKISDVKLLKTRLLLST